LFEALALGCAGSPLLPKSKTIKSSSVSSSREVVVVGDQSPPRPKSGALVPNEVTPLPTVMPPTLLVKLFKLSVNLGALEARLEEIFDPLRMLLRAVLADVFLVSERSLKEYSSKGLGMGAYRPPVVEATVTE